MRVVAIDGPVGSGKSTVAKAVARRLDLPYLETGAMYRVVALAAVRRDIDPINEGSADAVTALTAEVDMELGERIMLDGADVTADLRNPEVGRAVSAVAAMGVYGASWSAASASGSRNTAGRWSRAGTSAPWCCPTLTSRST